VTISLISEEHAYRSGESARWRRQHLVVENAFDQIARVDRTTGKIDEFALSVKDPVARKLGAVATMTPMGSEPGTWAPLGARTVAL
jgi:hypothetical protein